MRKTSLIFNCWPKMSQLTHFSWVKLNFFGKDLTNSTSEFGALAEKYHQYQVRLGNDNPTFVRIITKLSSKWTVFFVSWSFSFLGYLVVGDYEDGFLTGKEQVFFYSLHWSVFARSVQGTTIYALRALGIQKQNDNKLFVRISWETWTPPPRQCTEWKTQLALPEYSSTTLFSERGTQSLFLLEICAIF